jgi:hypothetical protein
MKITIHQPEHLPWLGLFHKVSRADVFVVLDNVQFRKNYFQNRNKARTADGWAWFTVPVTRSIDTVVKDVRIAPAARWKEKWWNTIYLAYKRAPYFEKYSKPIKAELDKRCESLSDFNVGLLKCMNRSMGIGAQFMLASEIGAKGSGSDLILDICKKLKADSYLAGISGRDYLKLDDFKALGVAVEFQEFHHPIYRQLYEPFVPCMSIVDLLFNHGEKSMSIINGEGVPVMQELFL